MPLSASGLPFDDIRDLLGAAPGPDLAAVARTRARNVQLVKAAGSLGRLEEIAEWLAAWQGRHPPQLTRPLVAIFATSHGVAPRMTAPDPLPSTQQKLAIFAAGGAAVNQLCLAAGAGLKVFDLGVDRPTPDITQAAAMSEADCAATIAFGMEAIAGGADLLCLGEVGGGNSIVAAAICCALFGGDAQDWIDGADAGLVQAVVRFHGSGLSDPLEILRRVGGREIAAIAGAIIAARSQRIPVLLDGFVVCAAAAVIHVLQLGALDHCMAAHVEHGGAHARLLKRLGKQPLLDLGIALGEGAGAALTIAIVRAAANAHSGMATFEQVGINPIDIKSE